jgi:hypothetical protein
MRTERQFKEPIRKEKGKKARHLRFSSSVSRSSFAVSYRPVRPEPLHALRLAFLKVIECLTLTAEC